MIFSENFFWKIFWKFFFSGNGFYPLICDWVPVSIRVVKNIACVTPVRTSKLFLTSFLHKFTFTYVHSTGFPFVARVHGMLLNIYLTSRPLAKTTEVFLVHLSSFPWRPCTRTIFLLQKPAWLAFEQGSLATINCQFLAVHTWANKTCSSVYGHGALNSPMAHIIYVHDNKGLYKG